MTKIGTSGRSSGASARVVWPAADVGGIPPAGGIEAAYRADIEAAPNPEARLAEIQDKPERLRSPIRAAEAFAPAYIIDPRDTRRKVAHALEMLRGKAESQPPKKHGNIPL